MSNNTFDGNDEYLRQQANFEYENYLDGIERERDMHVDDAAMIPVRAAWARAAQLYQDKLNKSIKAANDAKANSIEAAKATNAEKDKIFKYALNRPANNPDVPASIKDILAKRKPFDNIQDLTTKTKKGGKSLVFRKKSNKTKTKKVSRRNRRSRNIRRSRNSRAHERK